MSIGVFNKLVIASGVVSILAVVTLIVIFVRFNRESSAYRRAWEVCQTVVLLVVVAFPILAFINYWMGPKWGENPGGPSAYIIEALLIVASGAIAAPVAYLGFILFSCLSPLSYRAQTRRRLKVYGIATALTAAIIAFAFLLAASAESHSLYEKRFGSSMPNTHIWAVWL